MKLTTTTQVSVDGVVQAPSRPDENGSGALTQWLLANDLVDEMNLIIFPVVVGQGTRLFPDTGPDRALNLVEARATPSGMTIQIYRLGGRPRNATD